MLSDEGHLRTVLLTSCVQRRIIRDHTRSHTVSSTSSVRIKVETDKTALVGCMAALKRKHLLEAREEEIKWEKEQLAMETELAEVNAKLMCWRLIQSVVLKDQME